METSLVNILFSGTSAQGETATGTLKTGRGKDTGLGAFSAMLKHSMDGGKTGTISDLVTEKSSDMSPASSTDALSTSLDIIDALAFLPILLTSKSQAKDGSEDTSGGLFSGDALDALLNAIANALETGNVEDVEKALEGSEYLQSLLSGRKEGDTGSLITKETPSSQAKASTTVLNISRGVVQPATDDLESSLASLIAALDAVNTTPDTATGAADSRAKTEDSGKTSRAISEKPKTTADTTENSLASLIAALDGALNGSPEPETPKASASQAEPVKKAETEASSSDGTKKNDESGKTETPASKSNEDVVRNAMLLNSVLPNLLTMRSDTLATPPSFSTVFSGSTSSKDDGGTAFPVSGSTSSGNGSTRSDMSATAPVSGNIPSGNGSGWKMAAGTSAFGNGTPEGTMTGNQTSAGREAADSNVIPVSSRTTGGTALSEDYLLLNASRSTESEGSKTVDGKVFEVLFRRQKETAATGETVTDAAKSGETTPATPFASSEEGKDKDAVSGSKTGATDASGAKAATASNGARTTTSAVQHEPVVAPQPQADGQASATVDATAAALERETMTQPKVEEKKESAHQEIKAEPAEARGDTNPLARDDSTKTSSSVHKETQAAPVKEQAAVTIARKIEELADNFSSRSKSMDMVIRLNVDDKESIVVGLKNQGDKVLVEVKGASDGIMSTLQSQKDVITRELESKHIYTTINVDINGEGGSQGRERRGGQKQHTDENEQENFGSILNTLA